MLSQWHTAGANLPPLLVVYAYKNGVAQRSVFSMTCQPCIPTPDYALDTQMQELLQLCA